MKPDILALVAMLCVGCNKSGRVSGNPTGNSGYEFYAVACCTFSDGSYPVSVPQSQRDLCNKVHTAPDNQIDGDTYLPVHNGCTQATYLGHEYYQGVALCSTLYMDKKYNKYQNKSLEKCTNV